MFLALVGNAAVVVGLGGLVRGAGNHTPVVRPPGAIAEPDFIATCLKCQQCAEVCPTGVVSQVIIAESVLGFGTPRLSFRQGYCTLCMKCAQACPTGALRVPPGQPVVAGVAEISTVNCIAWNWGGCTKCYQVCPVQAVRLDSSERPAIDTARCTGCGQCEYECPSSTLRSGIEASGKGVIVIPVRRQSAI